MRDFGHNIDPDDSDNDNPTALESYNVDSAVVVGVVGAQLASSSGFKRFTATRMRSYARNLESWQVQDPLHGGKHNDLAMRSDRGDEGLVGQSHAEREPEGAAQARRSLAIINGPAEVDPKGCG